MGNIGINIPNVFMAFIDDKCYNIYFLIRCCYIGLTSNSCFCNNMGMTMLNNVISLFVIKPCEGFLGGFIFHICHLFPLMNRHIFSLFMARIIWFFFYIKSLKYIYSA